MDRLFPDMDYDFSLSPPSDFTFPNGLDESILFDGFEPMSQRLRSSIDESPYSIDESPFDESLYTVKSPYSIDESPFDESLYTVGSPYLIDESTYSIDESTDAHIDESTDAQGAMYPLYQLVMDLPFIGNDPLTGTWAKRVIFCLIIAMLLQAFLRFNTMFLKVPGRRRQPPGTTWPWDVKTALMVLWGVCWMFIASPELNASTSTQLAELNVDWYPWDGISNTVPDLNFDLEDFLIYTDSNLQTPDHLTHASFPGTPANSMSAWASSQLINPFPGNIDDIQALQPVVSRTMLAATGSDGPSTIGNIISLGKESVDSLISTASIENVFNDTTRDGELHAEYHSASSKHSLIDSANDPPLNVANQIHCAHPDCASTKPTFLRRSDWQKHTDKHNRPFVCKVLGCEAIRGYTCKGDLDRHQRETHENGGAKAHLCPHGDCKRSAGTPFKRKENLKEHLRRVHRDVEPTLEADKAENAVHVSLEQPDSTEPRGSIVEQPGLLQPRQTNRRKRRLLEERPNENMTTAANTNGDQEMQAKRTKVLPHSMDIEFDTVIAERDTLRHTVIEKDAQIEVLEDRLRQTVIKKDAQIELLKEMLQEKHSEQSLRSAA